MYPLKFNGNFGFVVFKSFLEFLCILKCLVPLLFSPVRKNFNFSSIGKITVRNCQFSLKKLINDINLVWNFTKFQFSNYAIPRPENLCTVFLVLSCCPALL